MPSYKAPIRDFKFALNEFLEIQNYSNEIEGLKDLSIIDPILEEGARFAEEILFPLNAVGDKQGLRFENNQVFLPDGFVEAYKTYVASGWASFACTKEYGGQGLPHVINTPLIEMICSANLSFGLIPGLTHGAYSALEIFGTLEQKKKYLPNLITGSWTGIMCLTEPQAGTDLGLIKTKAIPTKDGSYEITGTKIFISCGEHDASENIIHLILARLPDAPEGVKGISLFVSSKFKINEDGSLGERNKVVCSSIEHKMGIHASPTCVMNYDGATAYLVGEPNKGLRAMFTMMNEARILVGLQGLGIGEVAYQNALNYANERLQARSVNGAKFPQKPADPITVHPDVKRMLLTCKAFTEGGRVLACLINLNVDIAKHHSNPKEREKADNLVQLLTPIVKAYLTEGGTKTANLAVQIHGGYGYIREYGVEQYLRDCRITEIYEGTNGIQSLDLVGRKLPYQTGKYLRGFFHLVDSFIEENKANEKLAELNKPLNQAFKSLQQATLWIAQKGLSNKEEAISGSYDYLQLFSLLVMGYIWAKSASISYNVIEKGTSEQEFYQDKIKTAGFFMNKILPEHYSLLAKIASGGKWL